MKFQVDRLHFTLRGSLPKGIIVALSCLAIPSTKSDEPVDADKNGPKQISLEQLIKLEIPTVEAASKFAQKITEAPASVTVVEAEEIKRYGHRTLADVLRTVPGMDVSYGRNYSFLGLRGLNEGIYNSRVLLLINGHRMNNNLSDGAQIGTQFPLDVDLIERVEVIRGPSAVLYGNNAFFGVINVVTRDGRDFPGYGGEVSGEYGGYDSAKGRVTYGHHFENSIDLMLSGTIFSSEGEDRLFFPEYNSSLYSNGIVRNADRDQLENFFGSLSGYGFTLEGGYLNRDKHDPTAPYFTTFADARSATFEDRGYTSLKFQHEFPEVLDVLANIYYDRNDLALDYPLGVPATTEAREEQTGQWAGGELRVNTRMWERFTLTVGAEYRNDFQQRDRVLDAANRQTLLLFEDRTSNHGVFVQGDLTLLTNLHLNAGARYDQYGSFDPAYDPRVALIYNPAEQSTLKAIYGTAFRAPNFLEQARAAQIGRQLVPENIRAYELAYEQGIGEHLRSSLSGFYNELEDLYVSRLNPGTQLIEDTNLPKAESKGIEAALQGSFFDKQLVGRISYTYEETKDRTNGEVLRGSPEHTGKVNITVPLLPEKIFFGAEFQYLGPRATGPHLLPDLNVAGGFNSTPSVAVSGYGVVNLTLFAQKLVKGLEFSTSVYNLLDRHYYDPANPAIHALNAIPQDGRSFRVKLTYRF